MNDDLHVTVFVPKPLADAANQLSLVIGYSQADVQTFGDLEATVNGIECYAALLPARASFIYVPATDLTDKAIAKGAAPEMVEDAKSRLRVCDVRQGDPVPTLTAETVLVIVQDRFTPEGRLDKAAGARAYEMAGVA